MPGVSHPGVATSRDGQRDLSIVTADAGPLVDVVKTLVPAVLMALAEQPRALVCDLSALDDGSDEQASALVATSARQVRDWPAVKVAMVCRAPGLRDHLRRQPLSEHLLIRATRRQAVLEMTRHEPAAIAYTHVVASATASRRCREFVRAACLDWGLAEVVPAACLVASELATNVVLHARTDLDLTVSQYGGLLRIAVRDGSHDQPLQSPPDSRRMHGRGLALVAASSRAWGALPTTDGGKVVWAVLDG